MKLLSPRYASLGRRFLTEINTPSNVGDNVTRSEITASVVLIRPPLCAPSMSDIEKKYMEMQKNIEVRNSLKSDFELKSERDEILLKKKRQLEEEGKDLSELEEQIGLPNYIKKEEWEAFANETKARVIKKHDSKIDQDYKNLFRHPESNLLLSVKQKFDDNNISPWIFPQTSNIQNCLRSSIEAAMDEMFNGSIKMKMLGGAPFSYHKYRFSKRLRESKGVDLEEFFFFGGILRDLTMDIKVNDKLIVDYQWLTSEEIDKCMADRKRYLKNAKLIFLQ
uniref:39S ribosomal protein L46, mitochondrial (inferred by orthology to a human protein) n=1 Tax=Strongyloides venezuelensis TaxID=75913 RepID=A0A0K0EZ98_STRVS